MKLELHRATSRAYFGNTHPEGLDQSTFKFNPRQLSPALPILPNGPQLLLLVVAMASTLVAMASNLIVSLLLVANYAWPLKWAILSINCRSATLSWAPPPALGRYPTMLAKLCYTNSSQRILRERSGSCAGLMSSLACV